MNVSQKSLILFPEPTVVCKLYPMHLYRRRFNFIFVYIFCFFCSVFAFAETGLSVRPFISGVHIPSPSFCAAIRPDTFPAGAKNCQTAPLLCKNQLDGYTGVLSSTPNTETDPGPTISCGNIQNNQWLSFLAGSDSISLKVKVGNCRIGEGLQIAILSTPDCVNFKKINCNSGISSNTDTVLFSSKVDTTDLEYSHFANLTIGKRYYIMIDGHNGDVCDFKLNIDYGDILPVTSTPPTISGPSAVCSNSSNALRFSVPVDPAAVSYIWKVPNGATVVGPANGSSISVVWGSAGSGVLSAQSVGSCDTSLPALKNITVLPSLSGTLNQTICQGDAFNYNGKSYAAAGDYTTTLTSAGGCDSVVTIHLNVVPSTRGTLDTMVCAGGCVSLHNKTFCAGQPVDTIILRKAAFTGCDSIVRINVTVLDLTVSASVSGSLNCDVRQVTLDGSGSSAIPAAGILTYSWTNPSGAVIGTGVTQAATAPGIYTLTANTSAQNLTCSKKATVTVVQTGAAPAAAQLLGGNRLPCRQSEIYSISSPVPNVFHIWTVPKGAVITAGAGTAAVTINWSLGVNGDVCVSDSNSCGTGPSTCLSIRIREVSDSFAISGPVLNCPGDVQTYTVANDTSIRQFKWLVTGGSLTGGDGSAKVTVKWDVPGTGKIQVSPTNDCGTGKSSSLIVSVKDSTLTAPAISGAVSVCAGKTEIYNIPPVANARAYHWFLPDGGGSILGSDSATSANIQWSAAGVVRIGLTLSNDCGIQKKNYLSVSVKDAALNVSSVLGAVTVCPGGLEKYAVAGAVNVSGYKWTLSGGGAIAGSDSSATVGVRWLVAGNAQVCVDVQNDCQVHKKICDTVQVVSDQLDSLPIIGANSICQGGDAIYSVAPGGNVSAYKWSASAGGGQLIGPDTARTVHIRWPAASAGQVCLDAQNSCGVHKKSCFSVDVADTTLAAPSVSGSMNVCTGKTEEYSVPSASNIKTYKWTLPLGGGLIQGSDSAASARVRWDSAGNRQVCLEKTSVCNVIHKICVTILAQDARLDSPVVVGSRTVCPGSTAFYSIPANPNIVAYRWTVPSGGRQIGSAGATISIAWDSAGVFSLCLQITNNCGVVRQTCFNVAVKNTASALTIAGDTSVCNTRNAIYNVPANANTTYSWKLPAGAFIIGQANSNIVIVKWGTSTGGSICVTPTGGCSSGVESCIQVEVKKAPAAPDRINGPLQSCAGALAVYKVAPVAGAGVYVWNYPGVTTETQIPEVPVAWAKPGVFSIGVQTRNECGVSAPASLSVEIFAYPKSDAGKPDSICGNTYSLKAIPSAGGGTWSLKSGPANGAAQFSDPRQAVCNANVSLPGVYVFQWKEINGVCSDSATVPILFKDVPQLTIVKSDCAANGLTFTLQASVGNANPPYRVSGAITGTFNGNLFVSNPLKSGFNYSFATVGSNGCASDSLKGTRICNCATGAGSIAAAASRVCFGDAATVLSNNDITLSPGDATEFILHDGTPNLLGAILARNQTGKFTFLPGMTYDQTYYIALAAGKSAGTQVDLKAPCASVSTGIPVVFKSKTTARISGDTVLCKNGRGTLLFSFDKPGAFTATYQNGPNVYSVANAKDGMKTPVSISGTYTLGAVSDEDGCAVLTGGSATIWYRPTPSAAAGADQVNCTAAATLAGVLPPQANGRWYCDSAGVVIANPNSPVSTVEGLKNGKYTFVWRVQDSVCADQYNLDTVAIFIPITPPASDFAFIGEQNQTISGNVASFAPVGTYVVTRLNEPGVGHFSFFSSGFFSYIPEKDWSGIVTFKYKICSALCGDACDTGKVKIKINSPITIIPPVDTFSALLPTAITPNGDGKNDFWVVDHIDDFPDNELLVFNRWGDVVYRSKPYKNNWGGTNQNGEPLPTGTYYYLLKLRVEDGKLFKGDVTILR